MKTEIITLDPARVEDHSAELQYAADVIRGGGLVAFPTETVYGLGASALDADAARRIYEAKGRPSDNPLIAHVASIEGFEELCRIENRDAFTAIAENFIPGPITVIQKKREHIPDAVTAGLDTLAVRFPVHTVARQLILRAGVPVAAPSANLSGRPSPTKARHVIEDLNGRVDVILDAGECSVGVESTIVHIAGDVPRLLRPGAVTLEMLRAVLGRVECDRSLTERLREGEVPLAPGMKYRHYAPKAPVIGVKGEDGAVREYLSRAALDEGAALLCFEEDTAALPKGARYLVLGGKSDREAHARRLFDLLREFDSMKVEKIYTRIPDDSDIGLAVVNRLLKACGYTVVDAERS